MSNPPNKGKGVERGEYSIEAIVCYKASPVHYSRILYGIAAGPRGGRILVDLYNLERLAKYWSEQRGFDEIQKFGGAEDWLKSAATKSGKMIQSKFDLDCSNDEVLAKHARARNWRYLIRNRNPELYERLKQGILYVNWPNRLG